MNNIKEIPLGWKQKRLIDIADLQTGIAKNSKSAEGGIELPYLRVANVQDGSLDLRDIQKISIPETKLDRYRLYTNDLLLVEGNGNPENLGRCAIWDGSISDCVHQNHLFVVRPKDRKIDYRYLALQIMSERGRYYLLSCSKSSSGLATLNSTQLKGFPILLPSLPEQKAIADLLSTWDEAIEKTERLIRAKEKCFKGQMQMLISQQCDSWPHIKPKKIFDAITEKNFPEEELLSVTQDRGVIPRSMLEGRVMSPDGTRASYKLIRQGDFAISLRSFQGGLEYSNYQGIISPAYTVLRPKIDLNNDFYRLFFKSYIFIEKYLNLAVIGIRDGKQISIPDFLNIKIPVPPLEEQKEIAEALSFGQYEIDLLKQLAEKYRKQKRGLMQKLLTGKWRVNTDKEVA